MLARTIRDHEKRLKVAEQRVNTLVGLVNTLYARIGDPNKSGAGLTDVQSTFLATLLIMTAPPGTDYPATTATMAENGYNDLIGKLQRQGYMST